jgi:hypothetical protein
VDVEVPKRRGAVLTLGTLVAIAVVRYLIAVSALAALRAVPPPSYPWVAALVTTFALVWVDSEVLNPIFRRLALYRDAPPTPDSPSPE